MFHDRHHFHMRESQFAAIGGKFFRKFTIGHKAASMLIIHSFPGTQVQLVYGKRLLQWIRGGAPVDPLLVAPAVVGLPGNATGMGWGFPAVGIGVALLCPVAVVRLNRVLVALSGAQTRNKKFPYSRLVPSNMHRTGLFVPTVKIAD